MALSELLLLRDEQKVLRKKLKSLKEAEKRQMGRYLIAHGWRKVERGWIEPGKPITYRGVVCGTIWAFRFEAKRQASGELEKLDT